jgi:hypothetical protein
MAVPTLAQPSMLFVDGSNLLIALGRLVRARIRAEQPTDHELNLAIQCIQAGVNETPAHLIGVCRLLRRYWFGSIRGSGEHLQDRSEALRRFGYKSVLFLKKKGRSEKGVDLALLERCYRPRLISAQRAPIAAAPRATCWVHKVSPGRKPRSR